MALETRRNQRRTGIRERRFLLAVAALMLAPAVSPAQQSTSTSGTSTSTSLPSAPAPATTNAITPASTQGSTGGGAPIQVPTTSSLFNPYLGSVQQGPAVPQVIELSLDQALHMGISNNLGLIYTKQTEEQFKAQRLTTLNVLLPNIDIQGSTGLHQYNLAAQGFNPSTLSSFSGLIGGGGAGGALNFPTIVKVDVTRGQANLSQYLFDWAGIELVHALTHQVKSTERSSASSRGQVVQNVGMAYLRVLAAQAQVTYDQSLLHTDSIVLYQTHQQHLAGVVPNLDELRARVQYQTQQQDLIADQNTVAKSKIALNRAIGLAPEQQIHVSPATPYADLDVMSTEVAEQLALRSRQDYQADLEQLEAARFEKKAAVRERFPSLIFNSNYGITGTSGQIYHDTWSAVGTLNIPIFQGGRIRADRKAADYQLQSARAQLGNIRGQIRQQVRTSLIDVAATKATLQYAQSNVALSNRELEQTIEQFRAGVNNNLPVIEAESTLAQAQVGFISATYNYNVARLNFARNLGLIDTTFHPEWQGGRPAGVLNDRAAMGQWSAVGKK